jgi:hypothetical protein
MGNPNNRAGWDWHGFKIGDIVTFDGAAGPAQIINLIDPQVGAGTGLIYDIELRYVDPALRDKRIQSWLEASSEVQRAD